MPATTFPALLDGLLRADGARPLVTFYDDASGERVELSVTTYANWVAKTAGLVQDELGLERGDRVLVDLPAHWLTPVWLGAAWTVGLEVTTAPAAGVDLVVCGPDGVPQHAGAAEHVIALSLLPMGARFREPLPDGVVDYGAVVWGQPDSFLAMDPVGPDDLAWSGATPSSRATQADLVAPGTAEPGVRLLTDLSPATDAGLPAFLDPLVAGGSTVWVANPDPDGWDHRAQVERAHRFVRASG